MAHETFIDTSGFYALLVEADSAHAAAVRWLVGARSRKTRVITTDYVLDETATLLKARGHAALVGAFFDQLDRSEVCTILPVDRDQFNRARAFFVKHADHDYSFTDCTSFVIMGERGIRESLSKDAHFAEAGFKPLLA
jgi:predicted nucleic acid-binding protein